MSKSHVTPEAIMAKAEAACADARVLLEHGSPDGAVNRAYYAMFDAARVALLASSTPVELDKIKTHSGLIGIFGNNLIKTGILSKDMGRSLSDAFRTRLTADYDANFVELDDARDIVSQAEVFIAAIRIKCMPGNGMQGPPY